jgi:hypothetical protein
MQAPSVVNVTCSIAPLSLAGVGNSAYSFLFCTFENPFQDPRPNRNTAARTSPSENGYSSPNSCRHLTTVFLAPVARAAFFVCGAAMRIAGSGTDTDGAVATCEPRRFIPVPGQVG